MNLAICNICKNTYDTISRIPYSLTCGHSFCMNCLQRTLDIKKSNNEINININNEIYNHTNIKNNSVNSFVSLKCAMCKTISTYEDNTKIPKNYSLLELLENFYKPCYEKVKSIKSEFFTEKRVLSLNSLNFINLYSKSVIQIVTENLLCHNIFKNIVVEINEYTSFKNFQSYDKSLSQIIVNYKACSKRTAIIYSLNENEERVKIENIKNNYNEKYSEAIDSGCYYFEGNKEFGQKIGYGKILSKGILFEGFYNCGKREGIGCEVNFNTKEMYFGGYSNGAKNGNGMYLKIINDDENCYNKMINDRIFDVKINSDEIIDKEKHCDMNLKSTRDGIKCVNYNSVYNVLYKYVGEFLNNKQQGKGIEHYNYNIYEGNFNEGKRNGEGKIIHLYKQDWFKKGVFVDGKMNGEGLEFWNNTKYKGHYNNDAKEGYGKLLTENFVYKGFFYNNLKHGKGEYKSNEYNYIGEFAYDKKYGRGKLTNFIGNYEYDGEFKNNNFDGKGVLKYNLNEVKDKSKLFNYSLFEGEFRKGEKIKGKLISINGEESIYSKVG